MKIQIAIASVFMAITFAACGQTDKTAQEANQEVVQKRVSQPQVIDVADFQSKMELPNVQIIDVRTDAEIAVGHIPGASQMNVMQWDNFIASTKTLDLSKPVLVYCKSGGRSNKAATYLAENGFIEVYDLSGGITNWNAKGGKIIIP